MIANLMRHIREEVIGLLFNQYVFRTHQEIVRRNPWLQGRPRSIFHEWGWGVYGVANSIGVRRLASERCRDGDVNLVRLLDILIKYPGPLWECFERHHPKDAARARGESRKKGRRASDVDILAYKRLLGEDRKASINAAEKTNWFASKRVAHSVPAAEVSTKFSDLDEAIDVLTKLTEKYTFFVLSMRMESLEAVHDAGKSTEYRWLAQLKERDLLAEMKSAKLPEGWDSIFLEPWATPEIIAQSLGDMPPPTRT
jgi:hypothetical protein